MNKEERQKNGKMPKTFQKKLILYNMLVIICIASAVSFYNYRSYCQDVIISETNNSANRVRTLSERLQVAYDEMVNIVLNCAERKSLFFATTLDSPNKPYNTSMTVYASDVLRDFCAISGYSRYINKIVLYHNGLVLQAGNSFGASMDVENIMKAPWFSSLLYRENAQYTLSLEDNPFKSGKGRPTVPKLLPLLRPLQYSARNKPEESWVFSTRSDKLVEQARAYVDEHYMEKLTLADIADSLNISAGHLSNTFKKLTGSTLSDYIAAVKIEHAKELIDTHQYLMYEISDMLGFDNPYYFSKVFKKVTGISPREHENRTPAS